jgi:threonine synthase
MKEITESQAEHILSGISLRCVECASLYPALETSAKQRYRCDCGGVLDVEMNVVLPHTQTQHLQPFTTNALFSAFAPELDATVPPGAVWRQLFDERAARPPIWPIGGDQMLLDQSGVWRYRELILPAPDNSIISRPEGNTPLYPVGLENCPPHRSGHRRIGLYAGLERLFLKHEGENPTGSFKDRGMTVGVTMARLLGMDAVACTSTGNSSASLASYAALGGMHSIVFLPAGNVAADKLAQSLAYGTTIIQINADFDVAMHLVEQVCAATGVYLLNSLNPFRFEGQKAIGFEMMQQFDWQAPDWVVIPAGNLGNTSAIGKAFRQAYQLSLIGHMPRFAAIQVVGAQPYYRSFKKQFPTFAQVQALTGDSASENGNSVSYTRARRVIEESNGVVEEVTDEEILAAKSVIDRAGIGCELASAATLAGIRKLVARGAIKRDEHVVGILTGNLLKHSQIGIRQCQQVVVVEATMDAIRKVLTR